jgi:NAD(P)-dependent dehydrogenase (short-subunit alcohol dehydrogenase family)
VQVDVSNAASVERAFQEIDTHFGRIDFAVNNAALIFGEKAKVTEMSIDRFMKSMGVNAGGVLLCMQQELRSMLKRKSGVVVNIASISAHNGYPGMVDYCASKHAIIGLTKTAALEVARQGVRVVAVSPGAINTALLRDTQGDEYMKTVSSPIPIGRIAEPSEIVSGIFFLVSDDAAQFVGHTLHLDGGMNDVPPVWW